MSLLKLQARKVLAIPPREVLKELIGDFILIMDDGEIQTNSKETAVSSFFWEVHRNDSRFPLKKSHHFTTYLGKKLLTPKTHTKVVSAITDDWFDLYKDHEREDKLKFFGLMFKNYNDYYNMLTEETHEYYTTVDLIDIVNIIKDPKVKAIKESLPHTPTNVPKIQKEIIKLLKEDETLKDNTIVSLINSSLVSENQLSQCIGPWGYPTDIDSYIFKYPIERGYAEGLSTFYESLTESRSCAKSLMFSAEELPNVEYFARRMQLNTMGFFNLHRGDCGSTNYIPWEINNEKVLHCMEGVYYLDEETDTLKHIERTDKHLINKILKIRTIYGCMHEDPQGCCETCFGHLARNVIHNTNIGHQCAVTINEVVTQLVLSNKHYVGSGKPSPIKLDKLQSRFLSVKDKLGYVFRDDLDWKGSKLIVARDDLRNIIGSLTRIKNISDLTPSSVTSIARVNLSILNKKTMSSEIFTIPITFQGRNGYFTTEFLSYMVDQTAKKGFVFDNKNNYVFDLDEWDIKNSFIECPPHQFNTVDFSKEFATLLEGKVKDKNERAKMAPTRFMKEICNYVWETLTIPFTALSLVTYSMLVVEGGEDDTLPKPWTKATVGVNETLMRGRSITQSLAYQDLKKLFISPQTYLNTNRPDHVLDWMVVPDQIMEYEKSNGFR